MIDALDAHGVDAIAAYGETFLTFLESLPWPVIVVDEGGRVVYASRQLLSQRTVIESARAAAPALSDAFPEYFSALRGKVAWLTPQDAEIVRETPKGTAYERVWLRRLPWGACLIIVDQTALRQAEAADAQTTRLASLGFMVAGVSHELSNPLAAIYSMVQILQASGDVAPDALQRGLASIAANVKRMLEVSRRLVGFSRAEDAPRGAFRVDEAVDEAIAVLRHDPAFVQIQLERRTDPDAVVFGNAAQMQQVFFNIFLNALQAMQGQGRLSVVTRRGTDLSIEVAVRDNGPGVPEHLLPRIFEPFFTTKPTGQGTGLGLSISSEIAHEHGGSIRVDHGNEPGACFVVQLPAYRKQKP